MSQRKSIVSILIAFGLTTLTGCSDDETPSPQPDLVDLDAGDISDGDVVCPDNPLIGTLPPEVPDGCPDISFIYPDQSEDETDSTFADGSGDLGDGGDRLDRGEDGVDALDGSQPGLLAQR